MTIKELKAKKNTLIKENAQSQKKLSQEFDKMLTYLTQPSFIESVMNYIVTFYQKLLLKLDNKKVSIESIYLSEVISDKEQVKYFTKLLLQMYKSDSSDKRLDIFSGVAISLPVLNSTYLNTYIAPAFELEEGYTTSISDNGRTFYLTLF